MFNLDKLIADLTGYIEARISLARLDLEQEFTKVLSAVLVGLSVLFFALLAIGFFSATLAVLINEWTGFNWLGFLIVGFLYTFFGFLVSREKTITRFQSYIKRRILLIAENQKNKNL